MQEAGSASLTTEGFTNEDEVFSRPYIDVDETRGEPAAHRYVHGGFEGTDTRFSLHLPPGDAYEQRFFQYITPVPDSESLSQGLSGEEDRIGMALASGAIFIETNGGGPEAAKMGIGTDQTIGAYRANAAAARFARHVARQIYGEHRTWGFAYGGSGGAYRTIGSIENTSGVFDGAVPFVMGSPMAIPGVFTVRLHAMRVVGPGLDDVVDALDAGGSGDPDATLNDVQASALREATRMGFPPWSWYAWRSMGPHAFALLFSGIRLVDAAYFAEFWSKPGYAGHDHPELYARDRVQLDTSVAAIVTAGEAEAMGLETRRQAGEARGTADLAWQAMGLGSADEVPVAFRLADAPRSDALLLADLVLPSGQKLSLRDVVHDETGAVAIAGINEPDIVAAVEVDDPVRLDNSDILAVQTYHRHQVPPNDEYPAWDQFRGPDGEPLYPQRPLLLGPLFTRNATGELPSGRFDGKMIVVESLWDREAYPWQADWYRARVAEHAGDAIDECYRLWLTDRALHGDHTEQDDPGRVVSYIGVLHQALRDLAAWAQHGTPPPASTRYEVVDGQVVLPEGADRRGIQPVVALSLTANGEDRIEIAPGETVELTGTITAPPGTGTIVAAHWDFEGDGHDDTEADVGADGGASVTLTATHTYPERGTFFAVLRGVSQRDGDRESDYARIQNLARARIVVR